MAVWMMMLLVEPMMESVAQSQHLAWAEAMAVPYPVGHREALVFHQRLVSSGHQALPGQMFSRCVLFLFCRPPALL